MNEKAVTYYKNMFKAFKDRGMELSIVLYWFDMPLLFEKQGGFTNRDVIDSFVYYCEKCFELFDGLVDIWYIYNEPIVDVGIKYLRDMCYPNKIDFNLTNQAIYHMVIAHAMVVKCFKEGNTMERWFGIKSSAYLSKKSKYWRFRGRTYIGSDDSIMF